MKPKLTDKDLIDYLQAHEGCIECDNGLFEVSCAAPWGAGDARKDLRSAIKHAMSRARSDLSGPNTKFSNAVNDPHPQTDPRNGVAL